MDREVDRSWRGEGQRLSVEVHLVKRGVDAARDQSYFLFTLNQAQLARAMFPLGTMDKPDVRRVARELGLTVADKPDSHEICFVPDGDYAKIVTRIRPEGVRAGSIVHAQSGETLGEHKGVTWKSVSCRPPAASRSMFGVSMPDP